MKPGTYIRRCGGHALRVRVETRKGEVFVIPPSVWERPAATFGPEYTLEPLTEGDQDARQRADEHFAFPSRMLGPAGGRDTKPTGQPVEAGAPAQPKDNHELKFLKRAKRSQPCDHGPRDRVTKH